MIWNRTSTRIIVGILLLGAAILVLLPGLTGHTSLDGTVNARFAIITAPVEGTVLRTPPRVGTPLAENQLLTVIRNERISRATEVALTADMETARQRLDALRRQRGQLMRLSEELSQRLDAFQMTTVSNLEREVAVLERRINVSEAQQNASESELERRRSLGRTGIVAESAVEQAIAARALTQGEVLVARLNLEQLTEQLEAAKQGVFIADGQNDVPYSRQRQDEVLIQLADLDARIAESESRTEQLKNQLAEERDRLNRQGSADILAPFAGVVWRNNVVTGSNVVTGEELLRVLDCRELHVDVLVAEVDYDEIFPGRAAQVRLLGRSGYVNAEVLSVRGRSAIVEEVTLAATPPEREGRTARIRLALEPSDMNADYTNFCQVGRSVQVRFERRGLPFQRFLSGLWFSIS